ncbi:hypothetical protein EN943_21880 [Mesorhizobium sp. M7A.F.Ca.US.006.01.1.1]|uniref:hypothetical protein n=1 Tax=Mesorhizobium sp. M7A.F.Ca.US.006.01.1.1 TaxID=2496707 RepID=UPI000FCADFAC|nr:hypothetical protein [Mesorhizobium sp. M7A.F.Ca.US.006.01.1.1]RUZ75074.1 hypothetical protein EN943_21880 [Mesorhizobium sp. M7A.F.Ca.US.006.01.1.1]
MNAYAHSLRTVLDEQDATFANWNQVVTVIARLRERRVDTLGLNDLLKELANLSVPEEVDHLPEPASSWEFGSLRFTIEQEQN